MQAATPVKQSFENQVRDFYNQLSPEIKAAGKSALASCIVTTVISGFNPVTGIFFGALSGIGCLIEAKVRPIIVSLAQQYGQSLRPMHIAVFSCSMAGPLLSFPLSILGSIFATSFVNTLDPLQSNQSPNFYIFRC